MSQTTSQTPQVQVLLKAIHLIQCFTPQEPVQNVSTLCKKLQIPKSSVYRLLCTLQAENYVTSDSNGNYMLGMALLKPASVVLQSIDFRNIARPHLQKLADELGETIYLSSLNGSEIVYLDEIQKFKYMTFGSRLGSTTSAFYTAMGRLMLSQLNQEQFEGLLVDHPLVARTPKTITNPQELWKMLSSIAAHGYAFDDEEFETGVCCLAAPLRNLTGDIIAAFGISAPSARLNKDSLHHFLPALLNTAFQISNDLGYHSSPVFTEKNR